MSTLAAQEVPSIGTELPLVAFVKAALAPATCTLSLIACVLAYRQPFVLEYELLAITTFLVSAHVFRELPLTNGHPGRVLPLPGRTILADWLFVVAILLFIGYATKLSSLYSRRVMLTWFVCAPFALHVAEASARRLLARYLSEIRRPRLKVIVGVNEAARELANAIRKDCCRGMVLGFFDDNAPECMVGLRPGEYLGPIDSVAAYVKRHGVHVVYITLPIVRNSRVAGLVHQLRDTTASIYFVPSAFPLDFSQARVDLIGGIPAIAVCETPFCGINGLLKRLTDVVIAAAILLLIWPVLLAIAVGVKLSSPGPVLFRQRRYGLDGSQIVVYKFRSMRVCEDGAQIAQATREDPRVTPFGAFLRRTSLDELPQLLNVLQGSMSIVGPRPHAIAHNEQYRKLIDGYMLRHKVRPGITGWAQVNGYRGETAEVALMQKRVEHDLDYLKHWSLALDFWIILKTAALVMKDRHAY